MARESILRGGPVVAIGETGIDQYWDKGPIDRQVDFFQRHIALADSLGLPFIVHMRESGQAILDVLGPIAQRRSLRGVMHSFTGDERLMERCLAMGLHISFAGMVTYKNADDLRKLASIVPDDRLLIETDSPYLAPHPKRGTRPNEPALIVHTAACIAAQRGLSVESLGMLTTRNARQLFRSTLH
jgi:TatD DNase family protein